ncbi:hypothetical protein [Sphingomonas paucimobilis]|uniref:Uncharacterized protein n=1 Tax=Sphingomonas paucimobilis TaxID=13689 RepID=A0A7T3AAV0_SPHPI|nr:hypothetical protein [Sphingomonas paucimobilis]QPT09275.1 hypothetical protein I6G38_02920 [Sphingomonas paucimobilis]
MSPSHRLAAISKQVDRLRPDWRNPERYFEERSDIERALRAVAREVEKGNQRG